jgi:hypothetical protein
MKRPALLRRLPLLRWKRPEAYPLVASDAQARFPTLRDDFALLEGELMPTFRVHDTAALEAQNRFRLLQLLLIAGGMLATVLGTIQAALHGGNIALGIAEALLAGLLAPLAVSARSGRSHRRYLTSRLKAERLRSEYFVFLVRAGEYAQLDKPARRELLARRVADIDESETGT